MRLAAWLILATFLVGTASAQLGIQNPNETTPVTLYFHLDANQDFPINTQPPDDRYDRSSSLGALAPTTSCVPDGGGTANAVSKSYHTLYGFSTPGYVEYDFQEKNGPRIHPERGLAADVLLDASAPAQLTWFLETKATGSDPRFGGEAADDIPTVIPEVVVRATIRTGDDVSIGAEAYNTGSVIALGESEPMLVAPDENNPNYIQREDGAHIYRFDVPLTIETATIPQDEAYNIRIDTFIKAPGCDTDPDQSLMTSNVQVHTSPDLRPRLEWSMMNPVQIEYIHPQFVGDRILIHSAFTSPWGNYDVDEGPDGIEVSIEGPSEARSLVRTAFVQRHHEHGHHFEPVDVTYAWPFKLDQAERGEYIIEVTAFNDQGTGKAVGRAAFEIGKNIALDTEGNVVEAVKSDKSEDAPAVGLLAILGLLGLALTRRR